MTENTNTAGRVQYSCTLLQGNGTMSFNGLEELADMDDLSSHP